MNNILNQFDYRIRHSSNQFDGSYIVAFFFDPDYNEIYAVQSYDQEIECEDGSYIDSGYLIYSFIKDENGHYLLKVDANFEDNDTLKEYVKSNYFELLCYDPCSTSKNVDTYLNLLQGKTI